MQRLRISHSTEYQFAGVVTLEPHKLLLRPREGHDVHIESSRLTISPAHAVKWHRDVFDNSVAIVHFTEPADRLTIQSDVLINHFESAPLDFVVEDYTLNYPFQYQLEDRADLLPYQQPAYPNCEHRVAEWVRSFGFGSGPIETYAMLDRMNRAIAAGFVFSVREAEGVQRPIETLETRAGACRDFAALFVDACRYQGLAARFVSGYSHGPATEAGNASTHAWAEVYLPSVGWRGFDPTNGCLVDLDHIRVASGRNYRDATPTAGTLYAGGHGERLEVSVRVKRIEEATGPEADARQQAQQ